MKKLGLLAITCASAQFAGANIITQWNFNSPTPDGNFATGTTDPSIGTGTALALNVTTSFASGAANGGSTDPATEDNSGWQTTGYALQGQENGMRGVEFAVSTVGFLDIVVAWDQRHSNTSSRYLQLQYSLNGTDFLPGGNFIGDAGDTWFNQRTVDLSSIAGANDNPDFRFRIVQIFEPGTDLYAASNATSNYAATGTWRFDMVTVQGNVVPEPTTLAGLALGGLALIRRRRRN